MVKLTSAICVWNRVGTSSMMIGFPALSVIVPDCDQTCNHNHCTPSQPYTPCRIPLLGPSRHFPPPLYKFQHHQCRARMNRFNPHYPQKTQLPTPNPNNYSPSSPNHMPARHHIPLHLDMHILEWYQHHPQRGLKYLPPKLPTPTPNNYSLI